MELKQTFERAVEASRALALLDGEKINEVLLALADETERQSAAILEENARDLAAKDPSDPMYDRLMLTPARIKGIADAIRHVAALRSPVGEEMARWTRPNGMEIVKVRVPFGVVGVIYEARPNVSFDVFSLCFKTSNACILKGGSDAVHSNAMIISIKCCTVAGCRRMRLPCCPTTGRPRPVCSRLPITSICSSLGGVLR